MESRFRNAVLLMACLSLGADWPGFRGPKGDGSSQDQGLPLRLDENVVWKVKLPGPGTSSPVVVGGDVLVTCYSGYGLGRKSGGDVKDLVRHLLCLDRHNGKLRWQKDVPAALPESPFSGPITEHGYASSTPVADGQVIVVFFGRAGVLAFDRQGQQLWSRELGTGLNSWGSAASPLLRGDKVFINAAVESNSLVALDKKSGRELWRAKGIGDCWSTPLLVEIPGKKAELVLSTAGLLCGFDPDTGESLWQCDGVEGTASSSPMAAGGVVFCMGAGFDGKKVIAVKPGGRGDVTKTHRLWEQKVGASHTSLVPAGEHLFYLGSQAVCLHAGTGRVVFQERLTESKNEYAAPILADGRLYFFSRRSGALVLPATGKFEVLARADLRDPSDFNVCPAVSDGQIFVRSNQYLYCIAQK